MLRLQADKVAPLAEHNFYLEWQLPEQFSTELCSRPGFSNDQSSCGTYIDDIIVAEASCEDAWAKRPMSANIDTSKKNDESHTSWRIAVTRYFR
jgi:hypothetical protein